LRVIPLRGLDPVSCSPALLEGDDAEAGSAIAGDDELKPGIVVVGQFLQRFGELLDGGASTSVSPDCGSRTLNTSLVLNTSTL
jgi:hypothetical protein